MKIYQLAASGHYSINHARHTAYSTDAWHTEHEARRAMRSFFKYMTTPKIKDDTMVMEKDGLRINIHILELKPKKKEIEK
jgi:hypothetical protein